jgi:ribosome-associated protein
MQSEREQARRRVADADAAWPRAAARAAAAKTDAATVVMDVSELLVVTGYFVVTSAGNPRLVRAIAEEVERVVAEAGGPRPLRIEGLDDLRWVLMDYGDFVVHVFDDATRELYDLERLWRDAPRLDHADD